MLGKSLASPLLTCNHAPQVLFSNPDVATATPNNVFGRFQNAIAVAWALNIRSKKWILQSTTQIGNLAFTEEDKKTWEACREAVSTLHFSSEEADKILRKAFGQVHSPYWGEERRKEVPKLEIIDEILNYLRSLSLSDDDLAKLLKKFPEVLGCDLEVDIKGNVQILEKEWEIKGKTLRSLILRNPKVLGYNIDCKGDCMAQCTRCWARF